MYSNNILNLQESTKILNAHTKKVWKLIVCSSYMYIYIPIYTYRYICIIIYICGIHLKKLYTKTAAKEAALLPVKSSSDDDPGFRHGFGTEASLPLTQGAPAVSHNTTRLYWMWFNQYEGQMRSDAVTVLFWIFFYIFPLLCWCKSDFG